MADLPETDRRPTARVFDELVLANLSLVQSVGKLVRLSWAIIALNVVLIASVAVLLTWTFSVQIAR